jgi:hypothetical protein
MIAGVRKEDMPIGIGSRFTASEDLDDFAD